MGPRTLPNLVARNDIAAPVADRPADQLLVLARPVHVGGVEEVHAAIQGVMDDRDRVGIVVRAVEVAHAHAAEPDGRDFGPVAAEPPLADLEHVACLPFDARSCGGAFHPSHGIAARLSPLARKESVETSQPFGPAQAEAADRSSNNWRSCRTWRGVRPSTAEKQRFIWLWSQNPEAMAMSARGNAVCRSSADAASTRRRRRGFADAFPRRRPIRPRKVGGMQIETAGQAWPHSRANLPLRRSRARFTHAGLDSAAAVKATSEFRGGAA